MTQALSVDVDRAVEWLKALYRHAEGWVNLWSPAARASPQWAPADHIDRLAAHIERLGERGNLYFGAALRRERLAEGRGGRTDCACIPGLWLDMDWQSEVHLNPTLPANREVAVELARSFPLKPSAVVNTGWGFQVWWLFAEPVPAVEAERLLARWGATWDRLAGERGVEVDHVWNIDRVMRLPGTLNMKRDPRAVTFDAQFEIVYQPSDFDDLLDDVPPPIERNGASTAHLAGSRFSEIILGGDVLGPAGWSLTRIDRNGDQHWHHPGSSNDISATVYADDNRTCIWSDTVASVTGCPTREPLKSWALYTFLFHRGDFATSRRDILEKGFKDLQPTPAPTPLAAAPTSPVAKTRLVTYQLDKVRKVKPRYLWRPWLPAPKLVILDGAPEVGKSTLSLDITARITTGAPMPDGSPGPDPANVVLLSAEDDLDDTTVWRLEAAGADMHRIHVVDHVLVDDQPDLLGFPTHVDILVEFLADMGAVLVVIDVLMSYIDDHVDTNADAKSRRALQRLKNELRRIGCSALMLRHPRKAGGPAIHAGGGSIAFTSTVRSNWVAGFHPEDPSLRVLCSVKNNMARRPAPLGYQLVPAVDPLNECARVVWTGVCEGVDADQLTDPSLQTRDPDAPAVTEAAGLIRSILVPGEWMALSEFEQVLIGQFGISKATLKRARLKAGVIPDRLPRLGDKRMVPSVKIPRLAFDKTGQIPLNPDESHS